MSTVGTVESVWRYPVKSMRGEECEEIFAGFAGVYGDRHYAFRSTANRAGFPFFTAREQRQMLRFQPRFRHAQNARAPINLAEAKKLDATPVYAEWADLAVDVETPDGRTLAIDDPALLALLYEGLDAKHVLSLMRSQRALADCRPLSVISRQTVAQLAGELGTPCDQRRFRANIYLDLAGSAGFAEEQYIGSSLRLGETAVITILESDPRCAMVTFDPETGAKSPDVLKQIAQAHNGNAGVYAAVLIEGMVRAGDEVKLLANGRAAFALPLS